MKILVKTFTALLAVCVSTLAPLASGQRLMENLGRGVVAVRSSNTDVLVSWRLLGLDPDGVAFNIYRAAGSGSPVKLNSSPLTAGTNYVDKTATLTQANTYTVRPVVSGTEQAAKGSFTLTANNAVEPVHRVKIRAGGNIKFIWVGDLDGDGEYDFVLDRQTSPQTLEAYKSDGTFLWSVNMGPNSVNQDNISPGSSAFNTGHWDGVTVYDFDSNGKAEVALRIANGVKFGDGTTFSSGANDDEQFVAILDGMTGKLRASSKIPTDYISDGPMGARFGVGYLDGVKPSLVAYMKNRQPNNGPFNLMYAAWSFTGTALNMQWKWLRGSQDCPDGHNTRIIDVTGDGKDEIFEIGFCLNPTGTLKYSLGPKGVVHGDRFHITKMDPTRAGLQGYGIQQENPNGLEEYYYDATTGEIIWKHQVAAGTAGDLARGMAADIDPTKPGMEVWSFKGVYNAPSNTLTASDTSKAPWPHLGLHWDGDLTSELYNDGKIEKWNPAAPAASGSIPRLVSTWKVAGSPGGYGVNPQFHGDILGDWREEVILVSSSQDELVIFTTDQPTDQRIYTLAHNPAYRNSMTLKGYVQSHHVDYFLGSGMSKPPRPNIKYVGT